MAQAIKLTELGLEKNKIILDPGIGFGKTTNHNLEILNNLEIFSSLGFNTLLGASRKRLFSEISKENNPEDRISGTCATSALGVVAGINIFEYMMFGKINKLLTLHLILRGIIAIFIRYVMFKKIFTLNKYD